MAYEINKEIDEKLDLLQASINQAKGSSRVPGTSSCCFWHGNQSSSDNGLYYFRLSRFESLSASTKTELLQKMQEYYNTLKSGA